MHKRFRFAALLGFLALGCTPSGQGSAGPEHQGAVASLPSLAGVEPLRAQDAPLADAVAGHVAVIDLWATWCEPCRKSMPKVARLAQAYADTDLVVAGIHVGPSKQGAARFAAEAGIAYSMYADPRFVFADAVGTRSVPLLLVVDRDGRIVHRTHELDRVTLGIVRELIEG